MRFPYRAPFQLATLTHWVAHNINTTAPDQCVEMYDSQYAWYAGLVRENKRDVCGVPIKFLGPGATTFPEFNV